MASKKNPAATLFQGKKLVFLDGAMGTMIQASGVGGYACPEELNLAKPAVIEDIHRAYVKAGAVIIETNTFGASRLKLTKVGLAGRFEDIVTAAVRLARRAAGDRALVAGSIGPLGEFVHPVGSLSAEEAYGFHYETARMLRKAGVDFLLFETMTDLKEARAACLAAKNAQVPFAVSMTFEDKGRTLLGTPPESLVMTVEALGAFMVGVNCSAGPDNLIPIARRMTAVARVPIMAQPNAGIPVFKNGRTSFPAGAEDFAVGMERFVDAGVRCLGGCCGTTPEHIQAMVKRLRNKRPAEITPLPGMRLAGRSHFIFIGAANPVAVIGERINPTGRKQLAQELREGNLTTVRREISDQVRAGAQMLDLNAGAPGVNEAVVLPRILELAQKIVKTPLVIDSTNPEVLVKTLILLDGKAVINSVNASPKSLERILPLAARYGCAVVGLTMDDKGVPESAAARVKLAEKIIRAAADQGIGLEDILIDCLAVAAGSHQNQVRETLAAVSAVGQSLRAATILGISNVSFGLPAREELNASFLGMAVMAGLDAAIVNPFSKVAMDAIASGMVLSGRDPGASLYISRQRDRIPEQALPASTSPPPVADSETETITQAVIDGDTAQLARLIRAALDQGEDPVAISQENLVPALERVGELFEKKIFFLPQVLASAEAVRDGFALLKEKLPHGKKAKKAMVLLATVEGDIHDLGKNILKALLENFGFQVEDMGTNVPARRILERVKKKDIKVVGLSALMTTTLPAMETTVKLLKKSMPKLPVAVGGAVLTEEYAKSIGADGFAPDASRGVKLIKKLAGN